MVPSEITEINQVNEYIAEFESNMGKINVIQKRRIFENRGE